MHCKNMTMNFTPSGDVQLTLIIDGYNNKRIAQKLYYELKDKEITATLKEFKTTRSIEQNEKLWAMIRDISEHVNHSHREEDMMNIYKNLLEQANIKKEYVRILLEAKHILDENFRAVIEVPNSRKNINGKETAAYWIYYGSSKFNTKEMSELIHNAEDMSNNLGLVYAE